MMWSIPSETEHYKNIVGTHYYLIGRKNFEGSIEAHEPQKGKHPLILTRNESYNSQHPVFQNIDHAIEFARQKNEDELFVLGGSEIYKALMPRINRLYLSIVNFSEQGDAYFPQHEEFNWSVLHKEHFSKGANTPLSWDFYLLEKEKAH